MFYYNVAISKPLGYELTYYSDENLSIGQKVYVNVRNSYVYGYIVSKVQKPQHIKNLKPILKIISD